MKNLRTLFLFATMSILAGCGAPYLRTGDTLARAGDWETALVQYKRASEEHPSSGDAVHKVKIASEKVVAIWTKRGDDANAEGRLGEAAEWWLKAVELARPDDQPRMAAWKQIVTNTAALEYFGDVAQSEGHYEDSLAVYTAILKVHGDRVDLVQKQLESQRTYAVELRDEAESLSRRNLPGAALIAELRALQLDPLQQNAFTEGAELRKKIRSATRVAIQDVKLDDHGYRALGAALVPKLSTHLEEFAPYGPTKDPGAVKAQFNASILSFEKKETAVKGVDEVANDEKPSNVPVANPAVVEQKKVVGGLETKLAQAQSEMKKVAPSAGKKASEAQKSAGLAAARQVDQLRATIEQERTKLAALPPTVPPPAPPATWSLAWTETTRTVEATIRFEVVEPDFAEPIVVDVTHRIVVSDRSHDGNTKHHYAADPLQLPGFEQIVAGLAEQFQDGTNVIAAARTRRVERLIAQGREMHAKGADAEALDSFVDVIFMAGPEALPADAAAFVAKKLEHDRFREIVAVN